MKKSLSTLIASLTLLVSSGFAQSIEVTPNSVNIGNNLAVTGNTVTTGTATVGSLIVGTSTLFTVGSFESAEQPIPGSLNKLTVAHGLGGVPKFSTVSLRCKTADVGWSAGDEILLNSIDMVSNNSGATIATNATSFKLVQYSFFYVHNFSTGAVVAITPANWCLVFRAWR